jgi:hypothetical protein
MLSPDIPDFLQCAIKQRACAPLSLGVGWQVWAEPTPCPSCRAMRAFYIVRQGLDGKWHSGCWACDSDHLMRATARLFEVLG